MKRLLVILVALAPVAASAQTAGVSNYYESKECHPAKYQSLVGEPMSAVAQAGVEAGPMVRVFGPGAILSDEFNPYRVNIVSDDGQVVSRVYCG